MNYCILHRILSTFILRMYLLLLVGLLQILILNQNNTPKHYLSGSIQYIFMGLTLLEKSHLNID